MSRNSSGTYSLPGGNPVVTGTTISSTWGNTTLSDIATELTNSLDRSGRGAMLASLQLFAGTVSSPGLNFSLESTSGLYRAGAGDVRFSLLGSDLVKLTAALVTVTGGITASATITAATFSGSGASLTSLPVAALVGQVAVANGGTASSTAAGARTSLGVTATGADTTYAFRANNLSDLANVATARSNLGVTATGADTTYAFRANNLSDLANAATARSNLGVTATGGDATYAFRANNLSDLGSAATARNNLGLTGGTSVDIVSRNISAKAGTTKTLSTSAASGGSDGDIWYRY